MYVRISHFYHTKDILLLFYHICPYEHFVNGVQVVCVYTAFLPYNTVDVCPYEHFGLYSVLVLVC